MASFENLTTQELMILANFRNVEGYENMVRQQLESMFTTPPLPKPTPTPRPIQKTEH